MSPQHLSPGSWLLRSGQAPFWDGDGAGVPSGSRHPSAERGKQETALIQSPACASPLPGRGPGLRLGAAPGTGRDATGRDGRAGGGEGTGREGNGGEGKRREKRGKEGKGRSWAERRGGGRGPRGGAGAGVPASPPWLRGGGRGSEPCGGRRRALFAASRRGAAALRLPPPPRRGKATCGCDFFFFFCRSSPYCIDLACLFIYLFLINL